MSTVTESNGNHVYPFVGTSGRVMFYRFNDGSPANIWTSQASDPTIVVNGGSPIALTGRTAYAEEFGLGPSYVSYPLASKIEQGDVVTSSADAGWVSFGASSVAPAMVDEPVTNLSGQEMFDYSGPHTLKVGMNLSMITPWVPADCVRNMVRNAIEVSGVVARDIHFIPTELSGNAVYNIHNKFLSNGLDNRGTGGVEGTYYVTWNDYSSGRNKSAWVEAHNDAETTITTVGPKIVVATPGSYTRYRQQYSVILNPTRQFDWLGFYCKLDSIDVPINEVEVVGPGEDPDSTTVSSAYIRAALAGLACYRDIQAGEGISTNVVRYEHVRKRLDAGSNFQHHIGAPLTQVEAIPSSLTIRFNGVTYTVGNHTMAGNPPDNVPTQFVGLLCTTESAHGLFSGQLVDLSGIYNNDYSDPDILGNHSGVQINGLSGPIWMRFNGQTGVICWVVSDTEFICYPGYIVDTLGIADPIGVQTFDTSAGRSFVYTYTPHESTLSYSDQLKMAGELGAGAHIALSGISEDQCVTDVAEECRDEMIALGDAAPPFLILEVDCENWNSGLGPAYSRWLSLSYIYGRDHDIHDGETRRVSTLRIAEITTIFKDVFTAAGMGDKVKRGIFFQRFGDVELAYAAAQGFTFECGGPATYLFSTYPAGSWDAYTIEGLHDLWEWMLWYIFTGQQAEMIANFATYMPNAEVVFYEGGEDDLRPGTPDPAVILDFYYHWRNYRTMTATLACIERTGADQVNLYTWSYGIKNGTDWQHAVHNTQVAGLGIDPPNLTAADRGPTGNLDLFNQNPKLKAVHDWLAGVTPTPTPTPTPGVATLGTVGSVAVSVTATDATNGTPPYTYQWQVSADSGSTWTSANGTGVATLSATVTGLVEHAAYRFRLQYTDSGA